MNRRQMIMGAAAVSIAPMAKASESDPLAAALTEYKEGLARFNAELPADYSDEEANAFAAVTYGRVYDMDRLPAATSAIGVAAALQTVLEEAESTSLDDFCERVIRAAYAYFQREDV